MPVPAGFAAAITSEPEATQALRSTFERFADALPPAAEMLRGGDNEDTWEAWGLLKADLGKIFTANPGPYTRIAGRGAAAATRSLPIQRGLTEDARERAARWAAADGARLLTRETQKMRQAIRELTAAALRGTIPRREAARQIMAIRGFGLDSWRMGQLLRRVEEWGLEDGISERVIRDRARRLYKKLLFRRAKAVWAFESRSAAWEGARLGWAEAQKQGALATTAKLVWRHPGRSSGHPCPQCGALIGVEVGVVEDFRSRPVEGGGSRLNGKTLVSRRPPQHSRCDCYLEIST